MPRIELSPEVLDDFDRILDHLVEHEVADAPERIAAIVQAVDVLAHSPLIGRRAEGESRELIIGRDSRGYVALYRFDPVLDLVLVLGVRSQREAGYAR